VTRQRGVNGAFFCTVNPISTVISDATKTEVAWEGRPHPSQQEFARLIIAERDELRRQINEMKVDLDNVSSNLDSDIDALNAALGPPPATEDQFNELITKHLNNQWPLKVRLIDNLVEKTFLQLGCPRFVSSNP
jgi:hypothetical protein